MARYNLRSKVEPADRDSDGDSQRKRFKLSERKAKAKEEVIHVDSDLEIGNNSDVGEENNAITPDTWMEHPNALIKTDFYDFEKKRTFSQLLKGQIWAIYDDYGMPRRYVKIDQISLITNSIYVTFLKHTSLTQEMAEEQNNKETSWFQPVCGSFTPYSKGLNVSIYSFSHIVSWKSRQRIGRCAHNIYPKKGEVWALYKDGNRISSPRMQTYQLVEILTDYSRNGIRAVYLVKFGGRYRSLYKRHVKDGVEVFLQIGRNELERFSHQVPSFRIMNLENLLLNGCLELDPALLPFYIDSFADAMEPKINNKFLCLKVLDYKSLMMKEKLKENNVWALYDDRDGLPRTYAVIEDKSGREVITWLEPCPVSEDEKKWYMAGLPIACGNFKSKKTSLTCDYSMFSHPIHCDWDGCNQQYSIYPRKGEVWGIYKDWEIGWSSDPKRSEEEGSNFEYEFVEILTDFHKNEGVKVVSLTIVRGFSCLFRRLTNDTGVEIPFLINENELYRFSHQIQNCKIHESSKIGTGCLVLDPLVVFLNTREGSTLLEDTKEMDMVAHKKDCSKFEPGQVWALYEDPDQMPRSYAIICNTSPDEIKVEVKMLKPHPVCLEEMEWADKNLPISCGIFRVEEVTAVRERSEFSHQVTLCDDGRIESSFYRIIPKRGEVWAVYENRKLSNLEEPQRYQMVEIISHLDEESGLNVAPLFGVGGSRVVFQRHSVSGFVLIKTFSRKEMLQFSHRVPGSRIPGNGDERLKGHWKLDSAAIPIELSSL